MNKNQPIKLEFINGDFKVSDNFNTEEPAFLDLARNIGNQHYVLKDNATVPLTLLEKLEILCKKAREYTNEVSKFSDNYEEIRILSRNESYSIEDFEKKQLEYDSIQLLYNNLLKVSINNKYGVTDISGQEILSVSFDELFLLNEHFIQTQNGSKITIYDTVGKIVFEDIEDICENFNPFGANTYLWIKENNKWGLFDNKLNQIIPFRLEYDSCELLSDNTKENIYIKVYKDDKCGLINGLLNVEVISLDNEIEDIYFADYKKTYVITKKNNHEIELLPEDLSKIEDRLKSQN